MAGSKHRAWYDVTWIDSHGKRHMVGKVFHPKADPAGALDHWIRDQPADELHYWQRQKPNLSAE